VFEFVPHTDVRQIVGAVLDIGDGAWVYVEVEPIPVPRDVVPTSALAALHHRLSALQN
jgi:hypothetical protein